MNEQKKLFKMIQQHSFAVNEAALYLDTHPNCRQALRFYAKHRDMLKEVMAMYEEKYGPITMYGVTCNDHWTWTTEPWPWEVC